MTTDMGQRTFWRWLGAIVIAGALLRLPLLGSVPPPMYIDEYSNGYDAYSILLTGNDQHGVRYPLFFRALDDYRTPLHIYMSVPVTMVFGFGEMQTRLPYALCGILAILAAGCIGQTLLGPREGLFTAALTALSPWDVQFGRMALTHPIPLTALIPLGLCLLISGVRGRPRRLVAGFVVMALSLYSYPTAALFVPLLLLGFGIIARHSLLRDRRHLGIGIAVFVVLALPIYSPWMLPQTTARFSQVSIHNVDAPVLMAERLGSALGEWARPLGLPLAIASNYISSFSPRFLFVNGDPNLWHSPRGIGQLHIVEAPFILAGLISLINGRRRRDRLLLLWLFIGPLPAAFTQWGGYHAGRLLVWLPALHLTAARGITSLLHRIDGKRYPLFIPIIALASLISMVVFLDTYFVRYPEDVLAQYRYRVGQGTALRIAGDVVGPDGKVHVPPFTMIGSNIVQAYEYDIAPHLEAPPFLIVTSPNECTFLDASSDELASDVFIIAPMQPFLDPELPFRLPPDCEPKAHGFVEVGRVRYSNDVPSHFIFKASGPEK
ncbi:MAG: glycosyltransferase family 39 protein [Candidatus Undinarchaeales archaeon]|nr:glycosyltransferase family 39 protein [Candidatus Undinarchaeales archaeon]